MLHGFLEQFLPVSSAPQLRPGALGLGGMQTPSAEQTAAVMQSDSGSPQGVFSGLKIDSMHSPNEQDAAVLQLWERTCTSSKQAREREIEVLSFWFGAALNRLHCCTHLSSIGPQLVPSAFGSGSKHFPDPSHLPLSMHTVAGSPQASPEGTKFSRHWPLLQVRDFKQSLSPTSPHPVDKK